MQAIGYYLTLPFIYLLSILPFPLLYLLSDFIFLIMYYVLGYRRKVVAENIRKSFPEKSDKEMLELEKKFYHYLSDLLLEIIKTLTISKTTMLKHCRLDEKSILLMQKLNAEKKSCILVLGHLGNWEWASNSFRSTCEQPLYGIYHPLKNKYFNALSFYMRTRFGTKLIEMKNTYRDMVALKNQITATAFIADQTPPPDGAYWTNFMNQDTAIFQGTEKIAKKLNYPVIFMNVNRLHRGYYEVSAEMLCPNPATSADGEISELHTKMLEQEIRKNPPYWLWSHRRWKHKRKK
jgi:Kdo2-lipid IVA lauroyltransferase/acyltransferase